jgi:DNA-binding HxlR family transcriptional regulator
VSQLNLDLPPARTEDERRVALAAGNAIRTERANLKRRLHLGDSTAWTELVASLENPPDWLHSMKVRRLLLAMPSLGPVRVDGVLQALRISRSKTVGGLSRRQRGELLEWARAPRVAGQVMANVRTPTFERKWGVRLFTELGRRSLYFTQMQDQLEMCPRTLTKRLRELEREGYLWRHRHGGVPPRVEYGLTARGRALLPGIRALAVEGDALQK